MPLTSTEKKTPRTDEVEPELRRQEILREYLPKANAIVRELDVLGLKHLGESFSPDERYLEALAYALALRDTEDRRRALLEVTDQCTFNDECASTGVFISRVQNHATTPLDEEATTKLDAIVELLGFTSDVLPNPHDVANALQCIREEIEHLTKVLPPPRPLPRKE